MKKFILTAFAGAMISCSTQNVAVDYDRSQNFSELKDFRMEINQGSINELNQTRISEAIKSELANKGMNFQENSSVLVKVQPEEYISETQNSQVGIGVGGGNRGFGTSVGIGIPISSEKLNQRYLISMHNEKGEMVWEGRLDLQMPINSSPEKIKENIQKGVAKLFRNFPPNSKTN